MMGIFHLSSSFILVLKPGRQKLIHANKQLWLCKDRNTYRSSYSYIHEQHYTFKYKVFKDFYSVCLRTRIFDIRWEYTYFFGGATLSPSSLKTYTCMSPPKFTFQPGDLLRCSPHLDAILPSSQEGTSSSPLQAC